MPGLRLPTLYWYMLASLPVAAGLLVIKCYDYLLFHGLVEMFSVTVSFGIFIVAWNSRALIKNGFFHVLGSGFLCIGFLDLLHTFAYKGMGTFPEFDANLPTELWIAGRIIMAISVLTACFLHDKKANLTLTLPAFLAGTTVLLVLIFTGYFPDCFIEGQGLTPFKIISEYVICLILAGTMFLLHSRRHSFDATVLLLLQTALGLTIMQEMAFTLYSDVYGIFNMIGHFFKLIVTILIYRAIVMVGIAQPHRLFFRELELSRNKLAQNERRLNDAQTQARLGSWEWDAASGNVVYSDELCRLLGMKRPDLPEWEGLLPLLGFPRHQDLMDCLDQSGICQFSVDRLVDGTTMYLAGNCKVHFDNNDRLLRLIGTLHDVTERRELEELRENVERILRHDLRAPLTSILAGISLLRETVPQTDKELLNHMTRTAGNMLSQINMSMDVCRMEAGKLELKKMEMDLLPLLRQIVSATAPRLSPPEIAWDFDLPPDTQAVVSGDATLLHSLFENLIKNAFEAVEINDRITISIRVDTDVHVQITNPGEVPESIRDHFFKKYATYGKHDGTGIGTYAARLIAKLHGGTVKLDSSVPGQTTVTIGLPRKN